VRGDLAVFGVALDGAVLYGRLRPAMENPELVELMVRADSAPGSLSHADRLRYDLALELEISVYEAVYTNLAQGTVEPGLASGW
jgi:hypothetical protein